MDEFIIEPLGDNILVIQEEKAKKTATGILLPNESGEAPTIGEVIAVGEGKFLPVTSNGNVDADGNPKLAKTPMLIKAGDRVLYKQWGTNSVKMNGKEYYLLKQEDVLARITKASTPTS